MAAYLGMIVILGGIGIALHLRWPYYIGLTAAAAMMAHHYSLIRERSREGCMRAFRGNNWVGAVIFAGIVAAYQL
jgi:4-hydroxybenzoate polyprenyltransferase